MRAEAGSQAGPFDCVVDASVGIKLFLVEDLSERADVLFDHLTDAPPARFYVPDLFFIECTNILWKYVRRFDYPAGVAEQDVADLVRLPLHVVSTAGLTRGLPWPWPWSTAARPTMRPTWRWPGISRCPW